MNLIIRPLAVAMLLFGGAAQVAPAFAQDDDADAARKAAAEQVEKILARTDDVFFKVREDKNGNTFFNVLFERDGESTKIVLGLKQLGYYNGKYKFSLNLWTEVYRGDNPVPPAVVKAVATLNDRTVLGHFSCSSDFTVVYSNATGALEGATPASMWMYCAYLSSNKVSMREEIESAMGASRR